MFARLSTRRFIAPNKNALRHLGQTTDKRCPNNESIESDSKVEDLPINAKNIPNKTVRRREYRFAYPEFLPDPEILHRNNLREKLERQDMLARRENVTLPEFYVGSIVAVTTSKSQADNSSKLSPGHCEKQNSLSIENFYVKSI